MAKIILASGNKGAAYNDGDSIYGVDGQPEQALIMSTASNVTVYSAIDRVDLAGNVADYTFKAGVNTITVYNKAGTVILATIAIQNDTNVDGNKAGTEIAFANGSIQAVITPVAGAAPTISLGGVTVPTADPADLTIPESAFDTTHKSEVGTGGGGGVGETYNLTVTADIIASASGNDTINGVAGTLNGADVIVDSSISDNDVLNAVLNNSAPGTGAPTIRNIENINLDFKGFNLSFAATNVSNGTINASSSQEGNSLATLTGLTSTVSVAAGAGINTLSLAGDTTTLKMSGQTLSLAATTNVSKNLNINSTGSTANTLTIIAGATTGDTAVTGDSSLTVKTGFAAFTGAGSAAKVVTDALTGDATLTYDIGGIVAAAASDFSKVDADLINFNAAYGTWATTFKSGATVALNVDVSSGTGALTGSTAAAESLNLTLNANQTSIINADFETLTIKANKASTITTADFTTAAVNLTGNNDVTITTLKAVGSLDASGASKLTIGSIGTNGVAATGTVIVGSTGGDTISYQAVTNAVTLITGNGADTVNIWTGTAATAAIADTIIMGAGDDTISINFGDLATAGTAMTGLSFGSSSVLDGGAGSDTLTIGGAGVNGIQVGSAAGALTLTAGITNFENLNINLNDGATATQATSAKSFVISTNDANIAAGSTLNVKLTANHTSTSTDAIFSSVKFDGSAEADGSFNISVSQVGTGTGGIITYDIIGGAGNDTISAGKGNDTIAGGKGKDLIKLTQGGNDVIQFTTGDSGVTLDTADVISGAVGHTTATFGDSLAFFTDAGYTTTASITIATTELSGWTITTGVASKTDATVTDFIAVMTTLGTTASTGINKAVGFEDTEGNLYIFVTGADATTNADDMLVQLTGVGDITTVAAAAGVITFD